MTAAQHTAADMRGLPKPVDAVAPAEPPEMAAFLDALEDLVLFTAEDALNACSSLPGGRGCIGPDTATADAMWEAVIEAARKAFAPAAGQTAAAPALDNSLGTVHDPDKRYGALLVRSDS